MIVAIRVSNTAKCRNVDVDLKLKRAAQRALEEQSSTPSFLAKVLEREGRTPEGAAARHVFAASTLCGISPEKRLTVTASKSNICTLVHGFLPPGVGRGQQQLLLASKATRCRPESRACFQRRACQCYRQGLSSRLTVDDTVL